MSSVISSFQAKEPGSLTIPAPGNDSGCQIEMTAPAGSLHTAMMPRPITSIGSTSTLPPLAVTLRTVAAASDTFT